MRKSDRKTTLKAMDGFFKLKPLVAGVRIVVTGGMFVGPLFSAHADSAHTGLPELVPVTGSMPQVESGSATVTQTDHTMTITSTTTEAILNFQSYNVDAGNVVHYIEPTANSVVLNRIYDANPSQIFGQIIADRGQVFLYNMNGFVFGKDSVVDASSVVVSTLNISDSLIQNSNVAQIFDKDGSPALAMDASAVSPQTAKILIEAGAKIHVGEGGRLIVSAPKIENAGTLTGDAKSQIILAASEDKVYLQESKAGNPWAGLLVEVGTGGSVHNASTGKISVSQGNITLAGFAVNQDGQLNATTSVNINGSIRLVAEENATKDAQTNNLVATSTTRSVDNGDNLGTLGTINFGSGSITKVSADSNGGKALDQQAQPQSYIQAKADQINVKSNASIIAPSGYIELTATTSPNTGLAGWQSGGGGNINIDSNALLDASGLKNVEVSMAQNQAVISAESYDLRNSPLQVNGKLHGQSISVDLRQTNPIIDTSGQAAGIYRGVEQRLTAGGTIDLNSGGSINVNQGAKLDISGGSLLYAEGNITTTQLMDINGAIVNIANADPNQKYVGFADDRVVLSPSYVQGNSAGVVNISAPQIGWNGTLIAGAVTGPYQRQTDATIPKTLGTPSVADLQSPAMVTAITTAPFGGSFNINPTLLVNAKNGLLQYSTDANATAVSSYSQDIVFQNQNDSASAALILNSQLTNTSGVQKIFANTAGNVKISDNINMTPGGILALAGADIDVSGNIAAAGGNISLTSSGTLTVETNSSLYVSGEWVNDTKNLSNAALYLNGGSINLKSLGNLLLAGSHLTADGGAALASSGVLSSGRGGSIDLEANGNATGTESYLQMPAYLSAYGLNKNGSLTLGSGQIIVGTGDEASINNHALVLGVSNGQFDFSQQLGFSSITLDSNFDSKGLVLTGDVALNLHAQNLQLDSGYQQIATGAALRSFTSLTSLPEASRQPVQLTLQAESNLATHFGGISYNGITLQTGSSISLDAASSLNLITQNSIFIDGTITVPAGNINLTINANGEYQYDPNQVIWLGKHAVLSAQGAAVIDPQLTQGLQTGKLLDGGQVNITANRGYVVTEAGSKIDVSGTVATLGVASAGSTGGIHYTPTVLASNAGSIKITTAEGGVLAGDIKASASSGAQGGSLTVNYDTSNRKEKVVPPTTSTYEFNFPQPVINIFQSSSQLLPAGIQFAGGAGNLAYGNIPSALNGSMMLSADKINNGDLANLTIGQPNNSAHIGQIDFNGDVTLKTSASIDLNAQYINWQPLTAGSSGTVTLDTAFLAMGWKAASGTITDTAVSGNGQFTVKDTKWVELDGNSVWNGFNRINLTSAHDLRLVGDVIVTESTSSGAIKSESDIGSMISAAVLTLTASQIYPSTQSNFTIKSSAEIDIKGSNTDATPLSAGGSLTIQAPVINQDGVLKAPLGSISLIASDKLILGKDSLTSVSAAGLVIPYGEVVGGLEWLYPLTTTFSVAVKNPPVKQIVLNAPSIDMQSGSVLDVSGGGDLVAVEFKPVAPDIQDVLATMGNTSFAIMPSLKSGLAPYDPSLSNGWQYGAGSQVYLSGTGNLAAGYYTILPAYYALLPGAYLITPQANSTDASYTSNTLSGLSIVTGYEYQAGSGAQDARSSSFLVESSAQFLQGHPEYAVFCAANCAATQSAGGIFAQQTAALQQAGSSALAAEINADFNYLQSNSLLNQNYFANLANTNDKAVPLLPTDSGQIAISVTTDLTLAGTVNAAAPGGRGAVMDIAATNLDIVENTGSAVAGTVQIKASDLNNLKITSLLLGGNRSYNNADGSTTINTTANNVTLEGGVKLTLPDLQVVAANQVEVKNTAQVTASGTANVGETKVNLVGAGAFLRNSTDAQISLGSITTPGTSGALLIDKGATLSSPDATKNKSMLLYSYANTQLNGEIDMSGGSLNLSAASINIGDVAGLSGNALNLSNAQLGHLTVDQLILNSQSSVNFYGNVGQVDANGNAVTDAKGNQLPLKFSQLVINAAGITGQEGNSVTDSSTTEEANSDSETVRLQTANLLLENTNGVKDSQAGTLPAESQLIISTDHYTQGVGAFALNGFTNSNITVAQDFSAASGTSSLTVAGDLNLTAGYLTTANGANFTLNDSGVLTVATYGSETPVSAGIAGTMQLNAAAITFDAPVLMPSGNLTLHATSGDINVGSKANTSINLAGQTVYFAGTPHYMPGGNFTATADLGAVNFADKASLNLSASGGSAAGGMFQINAINQSLTLTGNLLATSGSAALDVKKFNSTSSFDNLMQALNNAGINQSINVRVRNDNINQGANDSIQAHSVTLLADNGAIDLAGKISTLHSGGSIDIYASAGITLENNSQLTADNLSGNGGQVLLSSLAPVSAAGAIVMKKDASIDVGGGNGGQGGIVTFRALRNGIGGINLTTIDGTINNASALYAEAVKVYSNVDFDTSGSITSAFVTKVQNETNDFMATPNIAGLAKGKMILQPGVEIDYTGNLALNTSWNLSTWRYGSDSVPGDLVIRASGDLTINQSLSDGFRSGSYMRADGSLDNSVKVTDQLMTGKSWSLTLVAGADKTNGAFSADLNRTTNTHTGNLILGTTSNAVKVRTGTGNIQVDAGGDITFNKNSTIYSAGQELADTPYGNLSQNQITSGQFVEFPVNGGNVSITAGGNINGYYTGYSFNTWLLKNPALSNPLAVWWGVDFGYVGTNAPAAAISPIFQQNIGAFGGGDVSIKSGGNISNLELAMPTTGMPTVTGGIQVNSSGNLSINAAGNIQGGSYLVGGSNFVPTDNHISVAKTATINANSITGNSNWAFGPNFYIGNTELNLNAVNGMTIAGISDPMILSDQIRLAFFSYTESTSVTMNSLVGDITLYADNSVLKKEDTKLKLNGANQLNLGTVYAPSLQVAAVSGNVNLGANILLFPSHSGQLNVFAGQNISSIGSNTNKLEMSDMAMNQLPFLLSTDYISIDSPTLSTALKNAYIEMDPFNVTTASASLQGLYHASNHLNDTKPAELVTLAGNISNLYFITPKQSVISSGLDINNVHFMLQNLNASDLSVVAAGRDIIFPLSFDPINGSLVSQPANQTVPQIQLAGPGNLLVETGRNLNLGNSLGITTVGNQWNPNLSSVGASITVLAGLNGATPSYETFLNDYANNQTVLNGLTYADYVQQAINLIRQYMNSQNVSSVASLSLLSSAVSSTAAVNSDNSALLAAFSALPASSSLPLQSQLNSLLLPILFNEIKLAGSASAANQSVGNAGAFAAIDALFSGNNWQGDINMYFSQINSEQGGDINVLAPGGQINAGLAVNFPGEDKASNQLGIIASDTGSVNVMLSGDFLVNTQRVMTLNGGDIVIWSTEGNIDAGKGAKTALSAPDIVQSWSADGFPVYSYPASASGSGIRAESSNGAAPGSVFLFAPNGVVNAGEAGIGGTNVTISATAVLGAQNIQVTGTSTGVPQAAPASVPAGLAGSSNATASASQSAEDSMKQDEEDKKKNADKNSVLGILNVEVLGYGE